MNADKRREGENPPLVSLVTADKAPARRFVRRGFNGFVSQREKERKEITKICTSQGG
jgi:hypothetical protein